jgi:hypothetical protein
MTRGIAGAARARHSGAVTLTHACAVFICSEVFLEEKTKKNKTSKLKTENSGGALKLAARLHLLAVTSLEEQKRGGRETEMEEAR